MNVVLVFPVALALAMDAFAVSVGLSVAQKGLKRNQTLRLAFHFGFFQFLMPLIGWLAGLSFMDSIRDVDHWVAFAFLFIIGCKMVYEAVRGKDKLREAAGDQTKGLSLFLLSIATSIDAFAVGISFAALEMNILYPSLVIGIVAFLLTLLGTSIGPVLGKAVGRRAELLGGFILVLIGIKIIIDHTF